MRVTELSLLHLHMIVLEYIDITSFRILPTPQPLSRPFLF